MESIDQIVIRSAFDLDENLSYPLRIEDDYGNILMETNELRDKAWELIFGNDHE